MKARWQQVAKWFDARTLRERGILLLCCIVVLVTLTYVLVLTPASQRQAAARQQISTMQREIATLEETIDAIRRRDQQDPDMVLKERRDELQERLADQRRKLSAGVAQLVAPQEIPRLLRQMLSRQQNLVLVSLENLPPEALSATADDEDTEAPVVYRHRLQLQLQGDYLGTLAYLQSLEDLPRSLVWEDVELDAGNYPQVSIRLQLYTLGLSKGWLGG